MKLRYGVVGAVLIAALAAGGIATAIGNGGDDRQEPVCGDLAGVCSTEGGPQAPEVVLGDVTDNDPTETAPEGRRFVGLSASEASALAEDEGRQWRIGAQDGESLVLTDDLVAGRVTFEVHEGIVTSATIESPNTAPPPPGDGIVEDPARADLISSAVKRLLTIDNGFGGRDVFDDIRVASVMGTDPNQPLNGLDLEMIAATLQELGTVRYIDNADAEISALFSESPTGVAVVSVERVLILDDRAEVELRLWCGSLCGVFLTYEAAPSQGEWNITGTTGPIAMS